MKTLYRILVFVERLTIGLRNLGLVGAIKLFFIYRSRSLLLKPTSVYLQGPKRHFYFRGAADKGVMSHFYKDGYRIVDQQRNKVRFIIDAGANIGDETIRFRYFHPEATIIAIEPEKNNFQVLEQNVKDDPRIITVNRGLWSKACRLRIIPGTTNESFKVAEVSDPDESYDILATSISQLMEEFSIPEIDILKMDIEGAEKQVFNSVTTGWLSKVKVFIFECPDNDNPGTTMMIFNALFQEGLKYNCYLHGENIILIRQDVAWTLGSDLFFEK